MPPTRPENEAEQDERHEATPLTPRLSAETSAPTGWTIPPTMTAVEAQREYDRLREEWGKDLAHHVLGDERHREHPRALAYYFALGDRAAGRDPAEGEEVIGEVGADGRMRAPADHPPIQMPVFSAAAKAAGYCVERATQAGAH